LKQEFFYFIYAKIKVIININMTKPSTNYVDIRTYVDTCRIDTNSS